MNKQQFATLFAATKEEMPGYQDRFVAFVTHLGFKEACRGNVAARNARFMVWISERKAQYMAAYPAFITGGAGIVSQEHFTNFIISGAWMD